MMMVKTACDNPYKLPWEWTWWWGWRQHVTIPLNYLESEGDDEGEYGVWSAGLAVHVGGGHCPALVPLHHQLVYLLHIRTLLPVRRKFGEIIQDDLGFQLIWRKSNVTALKNILLWRHTFLNKSGTFIVSPPTRISSKSARCSNWHLVSHFNPARVWIR